MDSKLCYTVSGCVLVCLRSFRLFSVGIGCTGISKNSSGCIILLRVVSFVIEILSGGRY